MADCLQYWASAELVPTDLRIQLHHESICLGLYADYVLPGKRSGLNYENHLKFVRFLVILPDEGAVFTRRSDLIGPAYRLIRSAIKQGYLEAEMDDQTGKTVVMPTAKLGDLISRTKPTDEELIAW